MSGPQIFAILFVPPRPLSVPATVTSRWELWRGFDARQICQIGASQRHVPINRAGLTDLTDLTVKLALPRCARSLSLAARGSQLACRCGWR